MWRVYTPLETRAQCQRVIVRTITEAMDDPENKPNTEEPRAGFSCAYLGGYIPRHTIKKTSLW